MGKSSAGDFSYGNLSDDSDTSQGRRTEKKKDYDELRRSISQYLNDASFEEDSAAGQGVPCFKQVGFEGK